MKKVILLLLALACGGAPLHNVVYAQKIKILSIKHTGPEPKKVNTLKVLFTGDLHSCAEKYPYLSTFIKEERRKAEERGYQVVTLDAGDIAMGSVYSSLFEIEATEYRALALMGYDAYVFGNHDFDIGLTKLGYMFYNSRIQGNRLNPINGEKLKFPLNVTANISAKEDNIVFKNALKYIEHTPYTILQRGNLKVGVFGLLGKGAYALCATKDQMNYKDPVQVAKIVVAELKKSGVDFIIALSHSGSLLGEKSEDALLAKEVQDIDLILSGHDHNALFEPLTIGRVTIASAGSNGDLLGEVDLFKAGLNPSANKLAGYALKTVPTDIQPDMAAKALCDSLDNSLTLLFNRLYRLSPWEELTKAGAKVATSSDITKSLFYAVANGHCVVEGIDTSLLVSVVPAGLIRGELPDNKPITYADAFNVLPLGRDSNGKLGYSLVYAYIKGSDLKDACELNVSVASQMPDSYLFFYGLDFTYNSAALPFCRVKKVYVHGSPVESGKLYPVVTDQYTASNLALLQSFSHHILGVKLRDSAGNVMQKALPIRAKEGDSYWPYAFKGAVSEWFGFAQYLKSGVRLPDSYSIPAGRDERSKVVYLRYALYLLLIAAVIYGVVKLRHRRKR